MLLTERSKAAYVLDHENIEMTFKKTNTIFVQIPPRTETGLVAKCKNAVDRNTRSIAACIHLSLITHKRVEFSFCRFDFQPPDPTKLKQPIYQLPKEMENGIIVAPNDNLRAERAESLANWRTHSNCSEDGAHKILEETTAVSAKLFTEEAAVDFFK